MESNSNSLDMSFPKIEIDSENESTSYKRDSRHHWNSDNTMKLIETMENECKELWDVKHPSIRDRNARQAKIEYLANMFGTTTEEISRKIHNLRTQFNNELRKIKKRTGCDGTLVAGNSGWEYFDALTFLLRSPPGDPLAFDAIDSVNLALAEFQADEEMEFGASVRSQVNKTSIDSGAAARTQVNKNTINNATSSPRMKSAIRVAASAPPPLPPSAHPMMWPEEPLPRLRPGANADECQIFGDFVASELRTLRSDESRRKLKRMIQKAILQVGESEDVNIICA